MVFIPAQWNSQGGWQFIELFNLPKRRVPAGLVSTQEDAEHILVQINSAVLSAAGKKKAESL